MSTQEDRSSVGLGTIAGAGLLLAGLASAQTRPMSDLDILNYALTLEHLEATFYNQGLRQYNSGDFERAPFAGSLGTTTGAQVFGYLTLIKDHENQHVRTLTRTIRSFGGTPVNACNYRFEYSSVDQFIALAQLLENTGVMAYAGGLAALRSPGLRTAAATIATVEARHAAYLNVLRGGLAAPAAFDEARTMEQILAVAGPLIANCPA